MAQQSGFSWFPLAIAANSAIYDGSCLALSPELHRVIWTNKFRPELPSRYDGTHNPVEFLTLYPIGIQAAGGDDKVMANWFPMALKDAACLWIMNLPEGSIASWGDLCDAFITNFRGTYECPLTKNDLKAVRQAPGETLQKNIQIGRAHV